MSQCAVKRGILTLRDCGHEGINTCSLCSRPVCAEHSRLKSGDIVCVECFAREEEEALHQKKTRKNAPPPPPPKPATENEEEWADPDWTYRYRYYYYHVSSYQPFYHGYDTYDEYYSGYDIRSFDYRGDEQPDDESAAGGFQDS